MCTEHNDKVDGPVHPDHTFRSRLCYFFARKHHRPSVTASAQWDLPQPSEFAVFDDADRRNICCRNRHLYGALVVDGRLRPLGTGGETVAKFQHTDPPTPWHGFPMWPLARTGEDGVRSYPAPSEALRKMREAGLITEMQRRRLNGGKSG